MTRSVLDDAFAHHVWATLRLIDSCLPLSQEQLATSVPGTYGSIPDTLRHLVGGDCAYLLVINGDSTPEIDEEGMGLPELRAAMEANGPAWSRVVGASLPPDTDVVRRREDGSESHVALSLRLAQALHHGTDHRSQICTALTTLGVEPPGIDVWEFAEQDGRVRVVEAPA